MMHIYKYIYIYIYIFYDLTCSRIENLVQCILQLKKIQRNYLIAHCGCRLRGYLQDVHLIIDISMINFESSGLIVHEHRVVTYKGQ